jgi:hypothetical protein
MPSTDKFVSLLGFSAIEILAWTSTALSANEDEEIVDRRGRVGRMKAMPTVRDRLPLELFSIAQSDLTSQLRHLSWIPDAPSGRHITGRNTRMVAVDVDGEALIIDSKCGLYGFFVTLPPTASHHTFCIDVAPIPEQPHIRVTLNAPHDGILEALCLHLITTEKRTPSYKTPTAPAHVSRRLKGDLTMWKCALNRCFIAATTRMIIRRLHPRLLSYP